VLPPGLRSGGAGTDLKTRTAFLPHPNHHKNNAGRRTKSKEKRNESDTGLT